MKILALGAHPDDVEVSAGGTIARFVAEGNEVAICNLWPKTWGKEGAFAAAVLGAEELLWSGTNGPQEVIDGLYGWGPDLIIAPQPVFDSHQEHRLAGEVAQSVARRNETIVWFMDHAIPGGWIAARPRPNHFVDTSGYGPLKSEAILQYKTPLAQYGKEWLTNIIQRDLYYGSIIGTERAEGFTIGFSRV